MAENRTKIIRVEFSPTFSPTQKKWFLIGTDPRKNTFNEESFDAEIFAYVYKEVFPTKDKLGRTRYNY